MPEVIKSWQVIAVTIALVFYFSIFFSVARKKRRKAPQKDKIKKKKSKPGEGPEIAAEGQTVNDQLGLEEKK